MVKCINSARYVLVDEGIYTIRKMCKKEAWTYFPIDFHFSFTFHLHPKENKFALVAYHFSIFLFYFVFKQLTVVQLTKYLELFKHNSFHLVVWKCTYFLKEIMLDIIQHVEYLDHWYGPGFKCKKKKKNIINYCK